MKLFSLLLLPSTYSGVELHCPVEHCFSSQNSAPSFEVNPQIGSCSAFLDQNEVLRSIAETFVDSNSQVHHSSVLSEPKRQPSSSEKVLAKSVVPSRVLLFVLRDTSFLQKRDDKNSKPHDYEPFCWDDETAEPVFDAAQLFADRHSREHWRAPTDAHRPDESLITAITFVAPSVPGDYSRHAFWHTRSFCACGAMKDRPLQGQHAAEYAQCGHGDAAAASIISFYFDHLAVPEEPRVSDTAEGGSKRQTTANTLEFRAYAKPGTGSAVGSTLLMTHMGHRYPDPVHDLEQVVHNGVNFHELSKWESFPARQTIRDWVDACFSRNRDSRTNSSASVAAVSIRLSHLDTTTTGLLIEVATVEDLKAISHHTVDVLVMRNPDLNLQSNIRGLMVYALHDGFDVEKSENEGRYNVRCFYPQLNVMEDPATGTCNALVTASIAAHKLRYNFLPGPHALLTLEHHRKSQLHLLRYLRTTLRRKREAGGEHHRNQDGAHQVPNASGFAREILEIKAQILNAEYQLAKLTLLILKRRGGTRSVESTGEGLQEVHGASGAIVDLLDSQASDTEENDFGFPVLTFVARGVVVEAAAQEINRIFAHIEQIGQQRTAESDARLGGVTNSGAHHRHDRTADRNEEMHSVRLRGEQLFANPLSVVQNWTADAFAVSAFESVVGTGFGAQSFEEPVVFICGSTRVLHWHTEFFDAQVSDAWHKDMVPWLTEREGRT